MKNTKLKLSSFLFLFFVVVGMLTACKSGHVPITTRTDITTKTVVKEEIKDTAFSTKPDSSTVQAALQIVDGKVEIKAVQKQKAGSYLNTPKLTIRDDIVTCDCTAEAQQLYARWKNTTIEKLIDTFRQPEPIIVPAELTWFQELEIWCGRVLLGLILAAILYCILKLCKIFI